MLNFTKILDIINKIHNENPKLIAEILQKSLELKGLDLYEAAALIAVKDRDLLQQIFSTAKKVKEAIYGKRLVIFAPLYISNICHNECLYCAFRASNKELKRRALTQNEIANETKELILQGQKRILLLAGESHAENDLQYILDAIDTIYKTKNSQRAEIRRINIEIAPLNLAQFKLLKQAKIGTYLLFQETYDREVYSKMHLSGQKADFNWRLSAMDRALAAGIDDVGLGVLFGLSDWRFEVLALLEHANYLQNKFGIGPHTISVPRLEPACGSTIASNPPNAVSDLDFCKIIAILRLAIPYTGIIMSTRETAQLRRETFELGVSQISAGSRTNPGGYSDTDNAFNAAQFSLGDHRTLDEVVKDVAKLGYIPSFCTACYRLCRTGEDFMHLAKSGAIKNMCQPNALLSFAEYLIDFASPETKIVGNNLIQSELNKLPIHQKTNLENLLKNIQNGKRDLFL